MCNNYELFSYYKTFEKNIYDDGDLGKTSTSAKFAHVQIYMNSSYFEKYHEIELLPKPINL